MWCVVVLAGALAVAAPAPAGLYGGDCAGDCSDDGRVTVAELVTATNILLGNAPLSECEPVDTNGDGTVAVNEIVLALLYAVQGC